jgi:site-specific recombinase XerC
MFSICSKLRLSQTRVKAGVGGNRSAPTAKLRLAALKHVFDWMVTGQNMPTNPAAAARGPRYIVRRGKTPVLDPAEARQLLDAIDTTSVIGLRDRALIGLMVYPFARIGAAIGMRVEDVYTQNRRLWVRLPGHFKTEKPSMRSMIMQRR